jgi:NAD(P)-dependent dehydrogenase (short-subunit alcohol dehydrogenase family)
VAEQVAFLTGAGSGIARATAMGFASRGKKVVVADLSRKAADETVAAIAKDGGEALAVTMDVRSRDQVDRAVADAVARFGRIDILLSAAGIAFIDKFLEMDAARWSEVLDTNLLGMFHVCQAVGRVMARQGHGHIIMMGSARGLLGAHEAAHYATSKAGVIALGKSLATELRPHGIYVHIVAPGPTNTPMHRSIEKAIGHVPEVPGGVLEPGDLFPLFEFLASEGANFMSGHLIGRI